MKTIPPRSQVEQPKRFTDNQLICDDLRLDRLRLEAAKCNDQRKVMEAEPDAVKLSDGITAVLYETRANVAGETRHFPHLIPCDLKTHSYARLRGNLTVNDVVMQIRLGYAKYQELLAKQQQSSAFCSGSSRWSGRYSNAAGQYRV